MTWHDVINSFVSQTIVMDWTEVEELLVAQMKQLWAANAPIPQISVDECSIVKTFAMEWVLRYPVLDNREVRMISVRNLSGAYYTVEYLRPPDSINPPRASINRVREFRFPADPSRFTIGQIVRKRSGARFRGKIVADPFLTEGPSGDIWHYNVVALHPDYLGTVHIMTQNQIQLEQLEPIAWTDPVSN